MTSQYPTDIPTFPSQVKLPNPTVTIATLAVGNISFRYCNKDYKAIGMPKMSATLAMLVTWAMLVKVIAVADVI